METLALAIERSNDAVHRMLLNNNNNNMSERIFCESFYLIKKSLNSRNQELTAGVLLASQQKNGDSQAPTSSPSASPIMPGLVQPSDQSLEAPQGDQRSLSESFFLTYTYRRPLYFATSSRFFQEHFANAQNDPIWRSYLIQIVTAVVLFNIGLCYQHTKSTIAASQSSCNTNKEATLGNAHSLYHSAARLLREAAGAGRSFFPQPHAALSEELEVVIWNNALQVAMELGDVDRGQEASQALYGLCLWKQEGWQPAGHQRVLVDSSILEQALANILSWRMAALPPDSAFLCAAPSSWVADGRSAKQKARCATLSMYAPAA